MIRKSEPLSMAEASEYLGKEQENLKGFIGKFTKIKPAQAKDFRKKLEELDLMKMNERHISKVIDLLPTTSEEVNKIFPDVSLNEDETKKIVDIVKQFE